MCESVCGWVGDLIIDEGGGLGATNKEEREGGERDLGEH